MANVHIYLVTVFFSLVAQHAQAEIQANYFFDVSLESEPIDMHVHMDAA